MPLKSVPARTFLLFFNKDTELMVEVSSLIKAVYNDEAFNAEIKGYLEKFYEVATETIRGYLSNDYIRAHVLDKIKGNAGDAQLSIDASITNKFNMQSIYFTVLEGVGISVEKREAIQREKRLVAALWVILLECFRNETNINDLKYPTLENFLRIYKSYGDNISTIAQESEKEKISLWHTANWMAVLLSMVPARKSKDLAIQVVPKLIEGWDGIQYIFMLFLFLFLVVVMFHIYIFSSIYYRKWTKEIYSLSGCYF